MLSPYYDPILVVGIERSLPARVAALLDSLGVDIRPAPLHLDATLTGWEDHEFRQLVMRFLAHSMPLAIFTVRLAVLSAQRRLAQRPWGLASAYIAEVPVAVLSQYLRPCILWCQGDLNDGALLLREQMPGLSLEEAQQTAERRHGALSRWLPGYRVLPLQPAEILACRGELMDEIAAFCGLTPTAEQLYQATVLCPSRGDTTHAQAWWQSGTDGHDERDGDAACQEKGQKEKDGQSQRQKEVMGWPESASTHH